MDSFTNFASSSSVGNRNVMFMEFVYKFTTRRQWNLYAGAGPALNVYSFDDNTDTEAGLNILFGAEQRRGLFFEVKIGAIDSPDLKFGVGYTWR